MRKIAHNFIILVPVCYWFVCCTIVLMQDAVIFYNSRSCKLFNIVLTPKYTLNVNALQEVEWVHSLFYHRFSIFNFESKCSFIIVIKLVKKICLVSPNFSIVDKLQSIYLLFHTFSPNDSYLAVCGWKWQSWDCEMSLVFFQFVSNLIFWPFLGWTLFLSHVSYMFLKVI